MNMLGHLRAEDFTNLLDGARLTDRLQAHLESCAQCLKTFESIQEVRSQIELMRAESLAEYIPEPDWSDFRSDVRNTLLSRAVKRENAGNGWLRGFAWRPAMAWGVSMLLVVGLVGLIWTQRQSAVDPIQVATEDVSGIADDFNSLAEISGSDIFDDLVRLSDEEAESLQMILADMTLNGVSEQ